MKLEYQSPTLGRQAREVLQGHEWVTHVLCVQGREASKVDPRVCTSALAEGQMDMNPGSASWKSAWNLESASLEMNRGELPWGWGFYETDFFLEVCGPAQGCW